MKFLKNLLPEIFGADMSNSLPDKPTEIPCPGFVPSIQPQVREGDSWLVQLNINSPFLTAVKVIRKTPNVVKLELAEPGPPVYCIRNKINFIEKR